MHAIASSVIEGEPEKLIAILKDLYQFDIYKEVVDTIESLATEQKIAFKVTGKRFSETSEGFQQTLSQSIYNKFTKNFFQRKTHIITIKKNEHYVVTHEIGHAIEKEISREMFDSFITEIHKDLSLLEQSNMLLLNNKIKRIFIDDVSRYSKDSIKSELFARYFEIFAHTKEVDPINNIVPMSDFLNFFKFTRNWQQNVLVPFLNREKISPQIVSKRVHEQAALKKEHKTSQRWHKKIEPAQKKWSSRKKTIFK